MKIEAEPEFTFSVNPHQWALPVFIAWMFIGTVISVNVLCFSVTYERWAP